MGYRVEDTNEMDVFRVVRTRRDWPRFWRTVDVSEATVEGDGDYSWLSSIKLIVNGGASIIKLGGPIHAAVMKHMESRVERRRVEGEAAAWRPVSHDRSGDR